MGESWQRGPLTYEQESQLKRGGRRVAVVAGTRAANFEAVYDFIKDRMDHRLVRQLDPYTEVNALANRLNQLRPERDTYICLVHEESPWSLHWVRRADQVVRIAKRGDRLRVGFLANQDTLWQFVVDLFDEGLDDGAPLFDWFAVQPWDCAFLRKWCSDLGRYEASAKIEELFALTGGWPLLLGRYAISEGTTWQRRSDDVEQYITTHRSDLLKALGLGASAARRQLAVFRELGFPTEKGGFEEHSEVWEDLEHTPIEPDLLRKRLFWATRLGLVHDADGTPEFNPLVARLLGELCK